MRVGILTFHEVLNPGAFWQTYATCQVVRRLGHEPVVINYTAPAHRFHPLQRLLNPGTWLNPRHCIDSYRIAKAFESAQKKMLPLSRRFLTHEDIMKEHFDAVLIGADIVWDFRSPRLGEDPVYFGEFLDTARLIAWSASMGGCSLDGEVPDFVQKGLPKFKAFSVRDQKTAGLVHKVCGQSAEVLPDPTFNLNIDTIPRGKSPDKPYIAVYAIPDLVSPEFMAQAEAFSRTQKLPLCAVSYRSKWADHNSMNAGPEDWLATLDRAEYVMTNTFHGTVFSILLGKKFVTEYNSAIESKTKGMIERLKLHSRVLRSDAGMEKILLADWDRSTVRQEINSWTDRAFDFLQQALAK